MPALPLHEAGKYVAGAYVVFFVLIVVYVSIMAVRLSRIERQLSDLLGKHAGCEHEELAGEPPERSDEPATEARLT